MTPFTSAAAPDFLALTYRPDLHLLVGRWQRPVTGAELRQGYRATLALAQAVGCPYWQLDLRGRNAPDADARRWLTQQFVPALATQLGEPAYLGYLLSPQLLGEMQANEAALNAAARLVAAVAAPAGPAQQVAFFAEEGALTAWLTQCQHRRPAALATADFRPPLAA